jgi:hypothetical protein
MFTLKKIRKALGAVLPGKTLARRNAQKQIEAGETFMDRYRDVFAALAK